MVSELAPKAKASAYFRVQRQFLPTRTLFAPSARVDSFLNVQRIDTDGDKQISKEEFGTAMEGQKRELGDADYRKWFNHVMIAAKEQPLLNLTEAERKANNSGLDFSGQSRP